MAIKLQMQPILTREDVSAISSIPSGDARNLMVVLRTLVKRISDYNFSGDLLTVTDGEGKTVVELGGSSVSFVRPGILTDVTTNIDTAYGGVTNLVSVNTRGILRRISIFTRANLDPGVTVQLQSSMFASNFEIIQAGLWSDKVKSLSDEATGTGGVLGDMLVLEFGLEFNSLSIDLNVVASAPGSLQIYVWYDKLG
jgi:hypothetical protein